MNKIVNLDFPFKFTEKERLILQRIGYSAYIREKKDNKRKKFFLDVCEQIDQNRSI